MLLAVDNRTHGCSNFFLSVFFPRRVEVGSFTGSVNPLIISAIQLDLSLELQVGCHSPNHQVMFKERGKRKGKVQHLKLETLFSEELHKAYPAFCLIARTNSQQVFQLPGPSKAHFQDAHFTVFLRIPRRTNPQLPTAVTHS